MNKVSVIFVSYEDVNFDNYFFKLIELATDVQTLKSTIKS